MKNKKVIEIYDQTAEEYSKRYDSIESDDDLVFLNTFLSYLKRGSHIVDLGCGGFLFFSIQTPYSGYQV